jgi:hypothetical protein
MSLCLLMHSIHDVWSPQYVTDIVRTLRPTLHGLRSADSDGNLFSRPLYGSQNWANDRFHLLVLTLGINYLRSSVLNATYLVLGST